jgi:subtilisin family serine protease
MYYMGFPATLYKMNLMMTIILLLMIVPTLKANNNGYEVDVLKGEFIIGFKKCDEEIIKLIGKNGFEIIRNIDQINASLVRSRYDVSAQDCLTTLTQISGIRYVEPNYVVKIMPWNIVMSINASESNTPTRIETSAYPNDPLWASDPYTGHGQWNMRVIRANDAWNITTGSHDVVVAVIDSGVYWRNPDLEANYIPTGYDWVNNDPDPNDDYGHGSWTAGIIAARTNNGYGVAGVAQVSLMAEKVIDRNGQGSVENAARGIIHAADAGADILSMSFGTNSFSWTLKDAVDYALSKGCTLVAAAGNFNSNFSHYPAAMEGVIAVASTYGEPVDVRAPYSNHASWITLSAPGGFDANGNGRADDGEYWVISTSNSKDVFYVATGTSASAPHVAGLAALYKSIHPFATNEDIRKQLIITADDKGVPGWDEFYGYGRINAFRALTEPEIISVGGRGVITSLDLENTYVFSTNYILIVVVVVIFTTFVIGSVALRIKRLNNKLSKLR